MNSMGTYLDVFGLGVMAFKHIDRTVLGGIFVNLAISAYFVKTRELLSGDSEWNLSSNTAFANCVTLSRSYFLRRLHCKKFLSDISE